MIDTNVTRMSESLKNMNSEGDVFSDSQTPAPKPAKLVLRTTSTMSSTTTTMTTLTNMSKMTTTRMTTTLTTTTTTITVNPPSMENQSPRNDSENIVDDYGDDYLSWTDNQTSQQPTTTMPTTTTSRTSLLLKCE